MLRSRSRSRPRPRPRSGVTKRIEDEDEDENEEESEVLKVSHLHVRRGDTSILHDISWSVLPSEHWAILGANGSGKTSLLTALTGYLTPTSGAIAVLGRHYGQADWRELRKQIGLVSS